MVYLATSDLRFISIILVTACIASFACFITSLTSALPSVSHASLLLFWADLITNMGKHLGGMIFWLCPLQCLWNVELSKLCSIKRYKVPNLVTLWLLFGWLRPSFWSKLMNLTCWHPFWPRFMKIRLIPLQVLKMFLGLNWQVWIVKFVFYFADMAASGRPVLYTRGSTVVRRLGVSFHFQYYKYKVVSNVFCRLLHMKLDVLYSKKSWKTTGFSMEHQEMTSIKEFWRRESFFKNSKMDSNTLQESI